MSDTERPSATFDWLLRQTEASLSDAQSAHERGDTDARARALLALHGTASGLAAIVRDRAGGITHYSPHAEETELLAEYAASAVAQELHKQWPLPDSALMELRGSLDLVKRLCGADLSSVENLDPSWSYTPRGAAHPR